MCDRGLTLGHLIGVLHEFFSRLGLKKLRFKPAYNPYTEPSMEIFRRGGLSSLFQGFWGGVVVARSGFLGGGWGGAAVRMAEREGTKGERGDGGSPAWKGEGKKGRRRLSCAGRELTAALPAVARTPSPR